MMQMLNKDKLIWLFKTIGHFLIIALLGVGVSTSLSGCASNTAKEGMPIYFINSTETGIEAHYFELTAENTNEYIDEMIDALGKTPEGLEYKAPLAMGISIKQININTNVVTIDFSESYKNLSPTTEVLVRAAIVKTLVSLDAIRYVVFTVEGDALTDATGASVGWMGENTFIYNDGNAINTYDEVVVKLYFSNEDGDKLIGAFRDKFYSTNIPLELFIVEELISGPTGRIEGLYATLNPETNIISVSTSDGICYVNLDSSFLTMVNNVSLETAIYSIVNSLTELQNINKVQILVNGEVPTSFASSYEYNGDILTTLDAENGDETLTEEEIDTN